MAAGARNYLDQLKYIASRHGQPVPEEAIVTCATGLSDSEDFVCVAQLHASKNQERNFVLETSCQRCGEPGQESGAEVIICSCSMPAFTVRS